MATLQTYLVFPGLLWTVAVAALITAALGRTARLGRALRGVGSVLGGQGSPAYLVSAVLALLTLALLPWPPPPGVAMPSADVWRIWALTEASFLAALLPGLVSPSPAAGRATVRAAQLGVVGRAALWAAIAVALAGRAEGWAGLAPLLVGAAAALLALPVAANWQPFGGEGGLGLGDAAAQLPAGAADLARLAAELRSVLLIMVLAVSFVQAPQLAWWQQLGLKLWLALAVALIGRGLRGTAVYRTLPEALRYCRLLVVPVTVLAVALVGCQSPTQPSGASVPGASSPIAAASASSPTAAASASPQASTEAAQPATQAPRPTLVATAGAAVASVSADASPTGSAAAAPPFGRTLQLTEPPTEGDDVRLVQQRLAELNYSQVGAADGIYGPLTEAAVRAFQQLNGLEADGIVGRRTWEQLFGDAVPVAEIAPVVALPAGWLLGGSSDGRWLDGRGTAALLRGGETYRIPGASTTYTGAVPPKPEVPCESTYAVPLSPQPPSDFGVVVGGAFDLQPRPVAEADPTQDDFRK